MKVLIVEEALKTLHGHWFQYISDIVNGGREAGHQIEVAVHKEACQEILKSLPCRPILTNSVFEKDASPAGILGGLKRVLAHNRSLYRDLSALLSAGNSYDVIIATTTRVDHLLAYEALHSRFRHRSGLYWVMIFVDAVGTYSPDYSSIQFSKKSLPLKLAMKLSRFLSDSDRFCMFTESKGLARRFEKFSGVKFSLVPHVTHLPTLKAFREEWRSAASSAPQPRILGTYGFTRFDKGLDVLQSAIKLLLLRKQPDIRFVLQWTGDYYLPDGTYVHKDPALEVSPLVQYIPAFSGSDEYYKWIARTDIMVLPYRKDFYFDRLSRVAIDAALAGMPLVYPAGTWLEWFVEQHAAGVAFQPDKASTLADAIQEVLANYRELKARAEARKQSISEVFSARSFFKIIAALPGIKQYGSSITNGIL